ncbi:MAG: hypothetical protein Q7T55_18550, partial [Solirubrobacteraceae bacterium]|nr:hypothetical protein [Solirubrobacteraceae bacterium]
TGNGEVRDWKRSDAAQADPVKGTTSVGDLAIGDRVLVKTSFALAATMAGSFDLQGGSVKQVSLKLTDAKLNAFNFLPGQAMQHAIKEDTTKGFTF